MHRILFPPHIIPFAYWTLTNSEIAQMRPPLLHPHVLHRARRAPRAKADAVLPRGSSAVRAQPAGPVFVK